MASSLDHDRTLCGNCGIDCVDFKPLSFLGGPEFVRIKHAGMIRYINVSAIKEIRLSSDDLTYRIELHNDNTAQTLLESDYISLHLFPSGAGYVSEDIKIEHRYMHMLDIYEQIKHLLVRREIKQV